MNRLRPSPPPTLPLAFDTTVEVGERPHDVVARAAAAGMDVFCTRCGPLARGARSADAELIALGHVEHWRRKRAGLQRGA
jgi:DhnA family fructose-bisphosphate aldolase class Ia